MDQARAGLEAMAKRAFRRPLKEGELQTYMKIVEGEIAAGAKFVDATKSAMTAILCSKSFLFMAEGDQSAERNTLNDWELASRLSYLVLSNMPEDELLKVAQEGKLHNKDELQKQLARLLADSRSERFTKSFPTQWLRLRKVGMFAPDKKIYPNYDRHLEKSIIEEPLAFFSQVLKQRLTLREFIDSDWTMVNPRLAEFYGLPSVSTDEFQRVSLKPENQRGGLLTQASVLSLTSDGTRHRPVHRGVWLSEVVLGKTPPPPPANVPAIEPPTPQSPKATLRQKIEAHRKDANCAACHAKIDPLGLAWDNYDAIGQWRTQEKVAAGVGTDPLVNPAGAMPDGRAFKDAQEFKQRLLEDRDKLARAFIDHLCTYALRRALAFDDQDDLNAIQAEAKKSNYRIQDIVRAVATSELMKKR
jgi:hypothetical protein